MLTWDYNLEGSKKTDGLWTETEANAMRHTKYCSLLLVEGMAAFVYVLALLGEFFQKLPTFVAKMPQDNARSTDPIDMNGWTHYYNLDLGYDEDEYEDEECDESNTNDELIFGPCTYTDEELDKELIVLRGKTPFYDLCLTASYTAWMDHFFPNSVEPPE